MPRMNGTGTEGKGLGSGRGLGKCRNHIEKELPQKSRKGMGKRKRLEGGEGKGRRQGI
jgi:hypothetical protein